MQMDIVTCAFTYFSDLVIDVNMNLLSRLLDMALFLGSMVNSKVIGNLIGCTLC